MLSSERDITVLLRWRVITLACWRDNLRTWGVGTEDAKE